MKPRYVVYGLEDEFNVERFKRLVKKEGYRILEDSLPKSNLSEEMLFCMDKNSPIQGAVSVNNNLHVFTDYSGLFWNLKKLADNFELE